MAITSLIAYIFSVSVIVEKCSYLIKIFKILSNSFYESKKKVEKWNLAYATNYNVLWF